MEGLRNQDGSLEGHALMIIKPVVGVSEERG